MQYEFEQKRANDHAIYLKEHLTNAFYHEKKMKETVDDYEPYADEESLSSWIYDCEYTFHDYISSCGLEFGSVTIHLGSNGWIDCDSGIITTFELPVQAQARLTDQDVLDELNRLAYETWSNTPKSVYP